MSSQKSEDDEKEDNMKYSGNKTLYEEVKNVTESVKKTKTIWVNGPTPPFLKHFKQMEQLGEAGQFGVTYKCQRIKDKETFAVKHLNKNRFYRIDIKFRHRYLRAMHDEIEILSTLNHKNIIKLEDVYEDKSKLYIIMEECSGGELFQRIVKKGQYNELNAAKIIFQILSALQYMHDINKIVHCDLKPDNILFLNKNEDSPIKIIDFGMSKILPRLQYLTHLCGTPYYTAPEIIREKKYNHGCDIWSTGIILYVMIFGYPPFYVDSEQYGKNERKAIYKKIKKGFLPRVRSTEIYGFGPWFPDHIPVSNNVKKLLTHMLCDVNDRYNAKDCLSHEWFNILINDKKINKEINNVVNKNLITSLAKFSNTCQFKLIVIKLFRNQFEKMRPQHFKILEDMFKKMDKNGDGIITYNEFEKSLIQINDLNLKSKYIKQMFNELNINDNKGIKFNDLLNALIHDYLVAADERLYDAFRQLDDDDDGKITTEQLKKKLKEIDPLSEWDRAINIIKKQTLDKNGIIDYEEFLLYLHPNFEETPVWLPKIFKKMDSIKNNNLH